MAQVHFLVAVLLVGSLCVATALPTSISFPPPLLLFSSPAPPPQEALPPVSPPAPHCPVRLFPFLDVKPLKVSCQSGIDAAISIRYFDEGLVEAGGYQLPSKGESLWLSQQIQVTTVHPFCVDFHIKCGSKKVLVTASVNLWLAKKIAVPTGLLSPCGEPLYCIELNLVIKGQFYEVYSGETLIVKKKF
jgi:hypothetical protein